MTNKEAIKILKAVRSFHDYKPDVDAFDMAISALEAQNENEGSKMKEYIDRNEKEDIAYFHGYSSGEYNLWNAVKYLYENSAIDFEWSASDVLREYKELTKKRPELYEEWTYADGTKCVVMDKVNDMLSVFTENGCVETCTTNDLEEYTGRTFKDVIVDGLLNELQKENT